MSVFLYNIFLFLYRAGMYLVSPFNAKARKWIRGRAGLLQKIKQSVQEDDRVIWVHCASLGEFEQGRPLMNSLKKHYPQHKILLTFFSPSGYEARKNFADAAWVFYLPMDSASAARRFLEYTRPELVIFVKYEFWYYYLKKIRYRQIPLLLVSALFREDMSFFRWYGKLQRKMLGRFDHLFVQNASSLALLQLNGLGNISSISGDTRFDRVAEIASIQTNLPLISAFAGSHRVIVAGSTWPEDEDMLAAAFPALAEKNIRLIIAPHEISDKHITRLQEQFPGAVRYSSCSGEDAAAARVLIIDNIGMLSRLYACGFLSYVGGGMKKSGVHNVLEAAVYYKPVVTGPYYTKYSEAVGLVASGGGLVVSADRDNAHEFTELVNRLLPDKSEYVKRSRAAGQFVQAHLGATVKILEYIQEKRLLTR